MLRLAVATAAETYDRMQAPLADRGIDVDHIEVSERQFPLSDGGRFGADEFDVGFVYPPRLSEGGVVDALLEIPWVNDRERILLSRHKGEALARLLTADFPVPETVVVSNPVEESTLVNVFERFETPVVVKPNATTRGTGVAKVTDLDSFLGICDYLDLVHDYRATGDRSFIVQEYLPDARDYRVMVVDGKVVGAVERRLPEDALTAGQWKHNVHRGAEANPVTLDGTVQKLAEKTAATLDIPWLGVDLLVTEDRVVVNEVNARPTIDSATKYEEGFWDDVATLIRSTA